MIKINQEPLPPIKRKKGPKPGTGRNLNLLYSLKPGDTVWNIGERRMRSILSSAWQNNIRITARKIPGTRSYAFQVNYEPKEE